MADKQQLSLKLVVDKEKNRVASLECDKDFIDILFSFMAIPIGTIIRLAGKQPKLGSLTNLYESVEDLDLQFLQTEACKTMLLRPYIALEEEMHEKLVVKMQDAEPPQYYICSSPDCVHKGSCSISVLQGTACSICKKEMNKKITRKIDKDVGNINDGMFVEGRMRYMVIHDLRVCPRSFSASLSLFEELGIRDGAALEEQVVNVGAEELRVCSS